MRHTRGGPPCAKTASATGQRLKNAVSRTCACSAGYTLACERPDLSDAVLCALWIVMATYPAGAQNQDLPRLDLMTLATSDFHRTTDVHEQDRRASLYGGKYPEGTQKAIASLGSRSYIEILTPQPGAPPRPGFPTCSGSGIPRP